MILRQRYYRLPPRDCAVHPDHGECYGLAGAYESPMVLPIAVVILFLSMYFLMRLFGESGESGEGA